MRPVALYMMRPIATHVPRGVVCVSVCFPSRVRHIATDDTLTGVWDFPLDTFPLTQTINLTLSLTLTLILTLLPLTLLTLP